MCAKKQNAVWTKDGVRYINVDRVLNGKLGKEFYKIMLMCEVKEK